MKCNKRVLVTGAGGFIGRVLIQNLIKSNYGVAALHRDGAMLVEKISEDYEDIVIDQSKPDFGLTGIMCNVDVVIHLAASVHVMKDTDPGLLNAFRKANVELTKRLAELAATSRVKRFVFISSLHVNGSVSPANPFNETDKPEPPSPYAISKLEAEQYLNGIAKKTNMEIVIIRSPLVYGSNVKANFLSLLKLTKLGLPLPVGSLNNKRSMISVNNLVDFIGCCIEHLRAANETFLISDDCDISTRELFIKLIKLFGKRPLLLSVSPKMLCFLGSLVGKKEVVDRLCSPLQVDITKAKTLLDWKPVQTLDDGLKETVEWYKTKYL